MRHSGESRNFSNARFIRANPCASVANRRFLDISSIRKKAAERARILTEFFARGNINWLSQGGLGKMPAFRNAEIVMAAKPQKTLYFESAMAELEQIVADMEAGKLSLEDSLAAYKHGAELLAFCRSKLEDAQQQVSVLENGVLKDFSATGEAGQA